VERGQGFSTKGVRSINLSTTVQSPGSSANHASTRQNSLKYEYKRSQLLHMPAIYFFKVYDGIQVSKYSAQDLNTNLHLYKALRLI
jgi:hypothetical protein